MSYPPQPGGPVPLDYARPNHNFVRDVALRQRAVMVCLLLYIFMVATWFLLLTNIQTLYPRTPNLLFAAFAFVSVLAVLAVIILTAVMVFRLALTVYGTGAGIVLGLLTLIPYLGVIFLLIVNGKATRILRENGIKVGLLGAKRDQIPSA